MNKANGLSKWACLFLFAALFVASFAQAQNEHAFVWSSTTGMTDIGTLGGNSSYALQINDSGEVAGWSYLADNVTYRAFTWTPAGGMVDLGTLGGCCSQANGINSLGNVVGDSIGSDGYQHPFFWSPATGMVSLGTFTGDQRNYAFDINNSNHVTGQVYFGEVVNAFIWAPGASSITLIGTLPGALHSVGTAINNNDYIVGTGSLPTCCSFTSTLWKPGVGMHDTGILPGGIYTANEGINDSAQVVGWGFLNPAKTKSSAYYWTMSTGRVLLHTLGGDQTYSWGISAKGFIAGYSELTGDIATHAVLWNNYTSTPTDLGTLPGGVNSYARGLNNGLQVVGYADVQ